MAITLQELVDNSILVRSGITVVWPMFECEEELYLDVLNNSGTYNVNNGTLAFAIKDTLFVTSYVPGASEVLEKGSYSRSSFYVPFSNGEFPKECNQRWQEICDWGKEMWKEDFVRRCNDYCDKHGIEELDYSILFNSFIMPMEGVKVKHVCFEDTYYPMIRSIYLPDYSVLGTFHINNGIAVFVDRDGNTRVAKAKANLIEALKAAGYKDVDMFVPFSNGESLYEAGMEIHRQSVMK